MNFSESKIYRISGINLGVSIDFSSSRINGINLHLLQHIENKKIRGKSEYKTGLVPKVLIPIKERIWKLLDSYFSGKNINHQNFYEKICRDKKIFSPAKSQFQQKAYFELCKTSIGEVLSYKQLASRMNSRAFQAVGTAMKKNIFPLLIPCHRVTSTNSIGGFMGKSSKLKIYTSLLNLKNNIPAAIRIKLALLHFEKECISDSLL